MKEIKIQVPEGYEIDKENSTLECIKFRPIKENITYKDICENIFSNKRTFSNKRYYYINSCGKIEYSKTINNIEDINNATNRKQLEKILALNQLLNITKYYNTLHPTCINHITIEYDGVHNIYYPSEVSTKYQRGIKAIFNNREDTKAVINNPNFRKILDTVYKD